MLANNTLSDKVEEGDDVGTRICGDEGLHSRGVDPRIPFVQSVEECRFRDPVTNDLSNDIILLMFGCSTQSTIKRQGLARRLAKEQGGCEDCRVEFVAVACSGVCACSDTGDDRET